MEPRRVGMLHGLITHLLAANKIFGDAGDRIGVDVA